MNYLDFTVCGTDDLMIKLILLFNPNLIYQ